MVHTLMPVADKANVRSIAASAKRPPVLLVTQVFPPVVGGSGQLLDTLVQLGWDTYGVESSPAGVKRTGRSRTSRVR